jgi:hypothetical protein
MSYYIFSIENEMHAYIHTYIHMCLDIHKNSQLKTKLCSGCFIIHRPRSRFVGMAGCTFRVCIIFAPVFFHRSSKNVDVFLQSSAGCCHWHYTKFICLKILFLKCQRLHPRKFFHKLTYLSLKLFFDIFPYISYTQ